ncbi:MAG: methyltransferase [Magnetococcales bacterium]|nr:methyltransferase [Magnetococcales bacterium]
MNGLPGVLPGLCRRVGGGVEGRLLAGMVRARIGERLAELGSGCGEVAIRVALGHPGILVDALEFQEPLNRVARRLSQAHGVADRLRILDGDVRSPPATMTQGGYAQVFCNPPFFPVGAGRLPPDPQRAAARFELTATLADFCRCAAWLLSPGGRLHLVLRPERLAELPAILNAHGLGPPRVELARARPECLPFAALITTRKA